MSILGFLLAGIFVAVGAHAAERKEEPFPSDAMVDYLMSAANGNGHGLRDERYFPYPSPEGFRIAFRQPVEREEWFRDGWTVGEAKAAFREHLASVVAELRKRLASDGIDFDTLPLEARELLLDFSVFDGVAALSTVQIRVVATLDWNRILRPEFYARHIADWPDSDRNKAFYERWKR